MNIHQNLRQLRQMTGLTQQQAAEQVGITRQALSGYESGRRQPDLEMLERLADLYHTDLMAILYGSTRQQKLARQIKTTALLLFGFLVGTTLLRCGLTLAINQLLSPASLSPDTIRNLRFPLLSFCSALSSSVSSSCGMRGPGRSSIQSFPFTLSPYLGTLRGRAVGMPSAVCPDSRPAGPPLPTSRLPAAPSECFCSLRPFASLPHHFLAASKQKKAMTKASFGITARGFLFAYVLFSLSAFCTALSHPPCEWGCRWTGDTASSTCGRPRSDAPVCCLPQLRNRPGTEPCSR